MNNKVVKIAGIVIAAVIVIAIALPLFINVNSFRPEIESNLSSALGRPVTVGNLSLSVLSGSVEANDLSIADDPRFSSTPFIRAKSLKVGVELMPLIFSKQLNVTHLVIESPQISILRDRDGIWNFSSLGNHAQEPAKTTGRNGSAAGNQNLSVGKLEISDGTIVVGSVPPRRSPITYDKVNISIKNFSFTSSFPVVVSAGLPGGGLLKIDGTAGPIGPTDASLTPVQAKVELKKLDLSQSALVNPEAGIAGSADFIGTLNSDGRDAKANGTLKASGLKLVAKGSPSSTPVQVVFIVDHNLQSLTGTLTQGDVTIGKGVAKLTGTYDMHGDTTSINMKIDGSSMPVDDLQGMLPAVGVTLPTGSQLKGGTLAINLNAVGPIDKIVATGYVRLSNSALTGFSMASKLSAIPGLGKQSGNDTVIQNLSANVRYAPDGTRLDSINVVIPSLATVTGAGTVSPSNALDFKMVANLSGAVGGGLTKVVGHGSGGIPVNVSGTTSNPTVIPDMKGLVGNQIKSIVPGKSLGKVGGLFGKKKN